MFYLYFVTFVVKNVLFIKLSGLFDRNIQLFHLLI